MKDFDDVNGQIVGGDYGFAWVTYESRQQGPKAPVKTRQEAQAHCESVISEIKADCGEVFKFIYPNAALWRFHTDNL